MRIDAQDTTALVTIHQMHSYSHMDVHYDPSLCSIPGVYPHGLTHRIRTTNAHHGDAETCEAREQVINRDVRVGRCEKRVFAPGPGSDP